MKNTGDQLSRQYSKFKKACVSPFTSLRRTLMRYEMYKLRTRFRNGVFEKIAADSKNSVKAGYAMRPLIF